MPSCPTIPPAAPSAATARRQSWVRIARVVAGLWFLAIYPALLLLCPQYLRNEMAPSRAPWPWDLGQYYTGGLVARHCIWDSLYPLPNEEGLRDLPRFTPFYPLASPEKLDSEGRMAFMPRLSRAEVADLPPKVLALEPRLKKHAFRYIYPPPLAWLLWPLSLFDLPILAFAIFPIASSVAVFVAAWVAAKIHRHLAGQPTYTEAALLFLSLLLSLGGKNHIVAGNATPFISAALAISAYGWLRGRQVLVGCCMIPMLLLKGITLNWCPLLLLPKVRWKSIATLAVWTLGLNAATLAVAGPDVYRQFFTVVLPSMNTPGGYGLASSLFSLYGIFPKAFYNSSNILLACVLYIAYHRNSISPEQKARGPEILAALAGAMALFCFWNLTVWYPYFANYCVLPFAGWAAWEVGQCTGRRHTLYRACAAGLALFVYGDWLMEAALHSFSPQAAFIFYFSFSHFMDGFVGPLFFYALALHRLLAAPAPREAREPASLQATPLAPLPQP